MGSGLPQKDEVAEPRRASEIKEEAACWKLHGIEKAPAKASNMQKWCPVSVRFSVAPPPPKAKKPSQTFLGTTLGSILAKGHGVMFAGGNWVSLTAGGETVLHVPVSHLPKGPGNER